MKKKKVLFISSTGGHLEELTQLKSMFDKYNYYIVTEKTKSKTGSIVYKFADLFIVQWKEMLELYPNAVYGGWIF